LLSCYNQFNKLGRCSIALVSSFAVEYTVRKPSGPELNGTHQLLVYADDANLLGDNKKHHTGTQSGCNQH
jgi:hypothetical protein